MTYDRELGLVIPKTYDRAYVRPSDDIPVYSYEGYDKWVAGATDEELEQFREKEEPFDDLQGGACSGFVVVDFIRNTTNYFDLEPAKKGYCFISHHRSTRRLVLLVPDELRRDLPQMKTAREVVAYYGLDGFTGSRLWRIVFDDGSPTPYVLHCNHTTTRPFRDYDGWTLEVWPESEARWSRPCRIRLQQVLSLSF